MGGFIMLKKFSTKASSFFIAVMMMVATFSTTVEAAKPTGGGGGVNTAPVIAVGTIPTLTEDTTTPGEIILSATDKEGNSFTWSIISTSFGTATLSGTLNPTAAGTITVNYKPQANKNGTAFVTVQAKDKLGAASQSTISIFIQPINDKPVNTTPPSISGTIAEGQTVSAINGVWSDVETPPETLVFSYQWQLTSSDTGTNFADIAGATTDAYTISSDYTGKYIRAVVTATDTGDEGTAPISTPAYSPWSFISPPAPVLEAQYYVALGDSISAGTNNQNLIGNSYRYTNTFSSSLAALFSGTSYSYKNYSVPGDDTDDLLLKLQTNSTIRSDVSKATIITISIGGNNLLSTASARGYSEINAVAATIGVNNFISDLPAIVTEINSLHAADHLPQIYIMDMYNLFHPYERGWVTYGNGDRSEVYMNQFIYANYLSKMQAAIDGLLINNGIPTNVYRVNTYEAFEKYTGRYAIRNTSRVKKSAAFSSSTNPEGKYFYSPYIEGTTVYSDKLTRFDIYPFYPILFDYANIDKYRDPHPEEAGHNVLKTVHLTKFKEVNHLN
jgi:lysophospholipase L1-like esterase